MSHPGVTMKIILQLSLVAALFGTVFAQEQARVKEPEPTFREPFTLKLRVDEDHYCEQHFDKVPYVAEDDVYVFLGDHFGVNLTDNKSQFLTVTPAPWRPSSKRPCLAWSLTLTVCKADI